MGSAGCDSFCKLWRVNVRGCVGTIVDLCGSWHVFVVSWPLLADCLADSGEYRKEVGDLGKSVATSLRFLASELSSRTFSDTCKFTNKTDNAFERK